MFFIIKLKNKIIFIGSNIIKGKCFVLKLKNLFVFKSKQLIFSSLIIKC